MLSHLELPNISNAINLTDLTIKSFKDNFLITGYLSYQSSPKTL